ncbi:cysteine--tRNA ligase [Chlorobaculum limnaeum]|uniref:Cysteine--tRNA ligase n=1 Tax=Chlorobaculum limnaeum TaxID=274537 RepID=A0A1D8D1V8_CHLLM|nr:cysteine--tRNA ligase [Chlorobaculum limnaeum]AOS85122.1 cysteine--tRNA ligase [Chlorobaculum limnaeum]
MSSSLAIYNSLSRTKEPFEPLHPGIATIYVCGPTVYGHAHLGHAKSYVSFDVVVRWMRHLGLKVKYVQNITDVGHLTDDADEGEDKIQKQARLEKTEPMEIAQYYTRSFYEDMDKLGVERPNIAPTATGHIPEQIALVERLVATGHAYESGGNVYFDVNSFAGYGKLSGRTDQAALQSGGRVAERSDKRNPSDFALWKKAEPSHIMKWQSPWGEGYPGWHLECSAMAMKYLGDTIDIHGGGMENKFPHHECEIAQSEAATGMPYVRYWMHNNMVTVDGVKMGKSLKNFVNLKELFGAFDPLVIRFFILQSHYRSPLDFSEAAIKASQSGFEKLQEAYKRLLESSEGKGQLDVSAFDARITDALNDDFNTPVAISVIFEFVKALNGALDKEALDADSKTNALALLDSFAGEVLGILKSRDELLAGESGESAQTLDEVMQVLLELRKEARANKDFATSDKIRDLLLQRGIEVKDTKEGATWSKKKG